MPHDGDREITHVTITCLVPVTISDAAIQASLEGLGARDVRIEHSRGH